MADPQNPDSEMADVEELDLPTGPLPPDLPTDRGGFEGFSDALQGALPRGCSAVCSLSPAFVVDEVDFPVEGENKVESANVVTRTLGGASACFSEGARALQSARMCRGW
ncbi:hypothetical protein CLAFUW4_10143 [Fulvia fulva]|uniref:Uncharacterized protein n=1 Tax=Passalora fulva TaxID=5499 RepID=A0A9Q8P8F6_PASFU|nr:uncharacterized protein CLAFUR5_04756 [Fulvia fulva]UJO16831.1 hypothetical protein CLAFUR5_04756 [Fulvia fulva]WPV19041.1 hypothetical protein CLAFUW4_10143 [Fulvia fulva]